jgi:hypothetical protein
MPDPPRRRGRPPVPAPLSRVSLRLPEAEHDLLCRMALQQRTSTSEVTRRLLGELLAIKLRRRGGE